MSLLYYCYIIIKYYCILHGCILYVLCVHNHSVSYYYLHCCLTCCFITVICLFLYCCHFGLMLLLLSCYCCLLGEIVCIYFCYILFLYFFIIYHLHQLFCVLLCLLSYLSVWKLVTLFMIILIQTALNSSWQFSIRALNRFKEINTFSVKSSALPWMWLLNAVKSIDCANVQILCSRRLLHIH